MYVVDSFSQMMVVTINKLVVEKVQLERDLAHASNHMEHLVSRSSLNQDQD